ncbi:MAG: hypothetical protein IJA34_02860 [Lachnospiraceae bacterium]|nr:hypothetical protein [Lachnospiraceae bacterium]
MEKILIKAIAPNLCELQNIAVIFCVLKIYVIIRAKISVTKQATILVVLVVRLNPVNDTISAKII